MLPNTPVWVAGIAAVTLGVLAGTASPFHSAAISLVSSIDMGMPLKSRMN